MLLGGQCRLPPHLTISCGLVWGCGHRELEVEQDCSCQSVFLRSREGCLINGQVERLFQNLEVQRYCRDFVLVLLEYNMTINVRFLWARIMGFYI